MTNGAPHNLMRPETMEALFVMFRVTRDPKYREWSWRIFRSYEKHCKVSGGYLCAAQWLRLPDFAGPGKVPMVVRIGAKGQGQGLAHIPNVGHCCGGLLCDFHLSRWSKVHRCSSMSSLVLAGKQF